MYTVEFQVQLSTVCYWKRQTPDAYGSLDEGHPCFIKYSPHVYGLPAFEYPKHVKVGRPACSLRDDDDDYDD